MQGRLKFLLKRLGDFPDLIRHWAWSEGQNASEHIYEIHLCYVRYVPISREIFPFRMLLKYFTFATFNGFCYGIYLGH